MAATSTVTGRYATRRHKVWDSFTDQDGKPVAGGQSLTLWIVGDDGDMNEIKAQPDLVSKAIEQTSSLTFGVEVKAQVIVNRYGYKLVSVELVKGVKLASAGGS